MVESAASGPGAHTPRSLGQTPADLRRCRAKKERRSRVPCVLQVFSAPICSQMLIVRCRASACVYSCPLPPRVVGLTGHVPLASAPSGRLLLCSSLHLPCASWKTTQTGSGRGQAARAQGCRGSLSRLRAHPPQTRMRQKVQEQRKPGRQRTPGVLLRPGWAQAGDCASCRGWARGKARKAKADEGEGWRRQKSARLKSVTLCR